ncbi:hypothetical protein GCM10022279_20360 [Comamonas faecalis]|uniref:ATP synthase subunit b n=1 Tax=Comamonas faecalis TaxID=1387849 RepID=A0ABP7RFD9_9BURK
MSIDWVTVAAQLVNFLVLVWLLRRFLYRPILDGIDAREAEIARRMAAADAARTQAEAAQQRYQQQYEHSVSTQQAMVAQALQSTEHEREKLLQDTRSQLEREQQNWRSQLEHEREDFLARLQQAGALTLTDLTRKALHELADTPLEAAIARHLGPRLAPLAAELRDAAGASQEATVTTHAALGDDVQAQLRSELAAYLPGVVLRFAVDAAQAPGLTIQVGGARVAWTLDSYMDGFERTLAHQHAGSPALSTAHGSAA